MTQESEMGMIVRGKAGAVLTAASFENVILASCEVTILIGGIDMHGDLAGMNLCATVATRPTLILVDKYTIPLLNSFCSIFATTPAFSLATPRKRGAARLKCIPSHLPSRVGAPIRGRGTYLGI